MKFNLISLFPNYFETLKLGVVGRALKAAKMSYEVVNPREFAEDKHRTVDDRPYGGGDGMVMLASPLEKALASVEDKGHVVYLSAQGRPWSDGLARQWAQQKKTLTLVCGRYGGIDQRVINHYIDEEICVGDYVLSGGEPAAIVLVDSLVRLLPGVLGNEDSASNDSFSNGLLEAPLFSRPPRFLGQEVPEVLRSGHHQNIEEWRRQVSLLVTYQKRPELLGLKEIEEFKVSLKKALEWSESELEVLGLERSQLEDWAR